MGVRIIYRISDHEATNPPPVLGGSRWLLNRMCLASFLESGVFGSITFILDGCRGDWEDYLKTNVTLEHKIIRSDVGINESAIMAVDEALSCSEDVAVFQECDYLWRPGVFNRYIDAIKHFGVASPYDHPDKYPGECRMEYYNHHWKTAPSTTQTYGITRDNIVKYGEIIRKYGYIDQSMWEDLSRNGLTLFTPVPSFATHMVRDYMAPNINWEEIWTEYL